jgi:hypothetical protein
VLIDHIRAHCPYTGFDALPLFFPIKLRMNSNREFSCAHASKLTTTPPTTTTYNTPLCDTKGCPGNQK